MRDFTEKGFKLYGSDGTAEFLAKKGIKCSPIAFEEVGKLIGSEIEIMINVPKITNKVATDMFPLRRQAIEKGLPVLTCMDTARAYLEAVSVKKSGVSLCYKPIF